MAAAIIRKALIKFGAEQDRFGKAA
jgi:hypothetical protein